MNKYLFIFIFFEICDGTFTLLSLHSETHLEGF